MFIQTLPIEASQGHILVHNIANAEGQKVLAKGTRLGAKEIAILAAEGRQTVSVAVLAQGDVHEDEAATRIAAALTAEMGAIRLSRAVAGRITFHATERGMLQVATESLLALNLIQGVTLATRPAFTVVGGENHRSDIATLKIIPYALLEAIVQAAIEVAPPILRVRPLPPQRVALLIVADAGSAARLTRQFEPPTRTRLEQLGSVVGAVQVVPQTLEAITAATRTLLATHDALFIGGQTSIMDSDDTTLHALRMAGVEVVGHGAPVEPGNMLAWGYHAHQWVLCAPGCAKSIETNVVDLLLPRFLAGERLEPAAIAALALGGLL
jgi:molybdenum cofactor cytidylyltransferase